MEKLTEQLYELIVRTSTDMPEDVEAALRDIAEREKRAGSELASAQLELMLKNIELARSKRQPLCQDTGLINFYVATPAGLDRELFVKAAKDAVVKATEAGILRKNSVCPMTGKNSGTNLGAGTPAFYWSESEKDLEVRLLLKGGGSENVGTQYALPDVSLGAERDIDGVKKCVIDAVRKAKGKGCPPSVLSVCIGGDRASGYSAAKEAFFRRIGERSPDSDVAELEKQLLEEVNATGTGTMGLGGTVTSMEVFVTVLNRHPASFFVTISQMCWSYRKGKVEIKL